MFHLHRERSWFGGLLLGVAVHLCVASMGVVAGQPRYLYQLNGDFSSNRHANLMSPPDLTHQENAVDAPLDFRNCFFSPVQCLLNKKPARSYRGHRSAP